MAAKVAHNGRVTASQRSPLSKETLVLFARLLNESKGRPEAPDIPAAFQPLAMELFRRALDGLSLNTSGEDFEELAMAVIKARRELEQVT